MRTRLPLRLPLLAAAGLLAACQPNPNPAQAGFFSGLANVATGTYGQRAAAQQAELQALGQQNLALRQSSAEEKAEQARLGSERASLLRRNSALQAELATMRRDLQAARAIGKADQAKLRGLSAQLATLEQASAQLAESHAESDRLAQQIAEAEARRARLRALMDQALSAQQPTAPPPPGS